MEENREPVGWNTCWECDGEGGYHDCMEDCCCCLDKEEITHVCGHCKGEGRIPVYDYAALEDD